MKSFVSALVLCSSLLAVLGLWLFPAAQAKEDPIIALLNLPAPPPPNPWARTPSGSHPPAFYDNQSPPPDDAPIEDLMDYWSRVGGGYQELGYNPKPSDRVLNRILREIEREPRRVVEFLNVFRDDKQGIELARDTYRQLAGAGTDEERELRRMLRDWLTTNSDEFAGDLEKKATQVKDVGEYVSNHEELLALAKVDWERAAPIVNRLYSDGTQKVSKTLATWALYKNALRNGGSDVDRYRDELKAVVEDKKAGAGARDLALDALIKEQEWSGRDDWYYSLLEDETLHNLVVDGRSYTGLTTMMYYTSDEGHVAKMLELTNSDNIAVRSAAVKNLLLRLGRMGDYERNKSLRMEIIRALLPWFSDVEWVKEDPSGKQAIVRALGSVKLPEAVPALIASLDEEQTVNTAGHYSDANAMVADVMRSAANAANAAANAVANTAGNSDIAYTSTTYTYNPLRSQAILALDMQADARAVPALRRVLTQVQEYERQSVVKALVSCNGFTVDEQVAAIEFLARSSSDAASGNSVEPGAYDYSTAKGRAEMALRTTVALQRTQVAQAEDSEEADEEFESYGAAEEAPESQMEPPTGYREPPQTPMTGEDLSYMLGSQLLSNENPSDDLVRGVVARIDVYDERDPVTAETMRRILMSWNGRAVNALLLRDLKVGRSDADAVVKLLSVRKQMREGQMSDIADARNGGPLAQGVAPCLLEDAASMEAVLDSGGDQARAALLACARLIRAQLAVSKAASLLKSPNKMLALAAERYLESEDSPEARAVVLGMYPNQAKILGAKTSFETNVTMATPGKFLTALFASVSPYFAAEEYAYSTFNYDSSVVEVEKRLQKEVFADPELIGIYAYGRSFVHIYKDRAVFSWSDDPARYRERVLEQTEWENFKEYLAHHDVDKLPPFLACTGECDSFQLLMLSRQGGRRVFAKTSERPPEFIAGLDKIFEEMRQRPAKLKYYAGAAVPGLEVHFADDRRAATTVWKEGADLRVLVTDEDRSKSIESEIVKLQEEAEASLENGADNSAHYQKFYKMREDRKYDSSGWFRLAGDAVGEAVPQPQEAEYIPLRDGFSPSAAWGQWKAKTPNLQIRGDDTGLYKITAGRVTRIRSGNYSDPVVTTNGRWVIAAKYSDASGMSLVRVNLLNNREFPIRPGDYSISRPVAYIASVNRFLVTSYSEEDHHGEYENENYNESAYDDGRGYFFLDPETGAVTRSVGEVRPIAQQTFRSLQPTGAPGEFWAALPRGTAGTLVGRYSTRTFTFKPMLKLPKIIFDSTEMWVDQAAQRVWFTYQGHVLSAPLK